MTAMVDTSKVVLFIIDPQVDFHPGGSLGINGANEDSQRTADFIRDNKHLITHIYISLDSHHRTHIAHGICWEDENGNSPQPFTVISNEDIEAGKWKPRDPKLLDHCKFYTKALEEKGRFKLIIWPEHCLIGTPGHAVEKTLNSALQEWAGANLANIHYVMKGTNCLVEMYSAIGAEVEIKADPSTCINHNLLGHLNSSEKLIICGQALSHCVNYTTRDIVDNWEGDKSRIIVLKDACSPVAGYEESGKKFLEDMAAVGVTITTCDNVFKK